MGKDVELAVEAKGIIGSREMPLDPASLMDVTDVASNAPVRPAPQNEGERLVKTLDPYRDSLCKIVSCVKVHSGKRCAVESSRGHLGKIQISVDYVSWANCLTPVMDSVSNACRPVAIQLITQVYADLRQHCKFARVKPAAI